MGDSGLREGDLGSRDVPESRGDVPGSRGEDQAQGRATPVIDQGIAERFANLDELESRLQDVARHADEAETDRDNRFMESEGERHRIFEDAERRRDAEAQEAREALLSALESRLEAPLPPPAVEPIPDVPPPETVPEDDGLSLHSIQAATQEAMSRHSEDLRDIVKMERDEMKAELEREREQHAQERAQAREDLERARAELDAERAKLVEEKDARIHELENEMARMKEEMEAEKEQRSAELLQQREEASKELADGFTGLNAGLEALQNMMNEQKQCCEEKKALCEKRWADKEERRNQKKGDTDEMLILLKRIEEMVNECREEQKADKEATAGKPGPEQIIEQLKEQNHEQQELLRSLSETWMADCARHHQETVDAVRQTANEQVPFNVQGYLDEFSKALASEVRILLGEVGKLREERRGLQHEIGFLLTTKSKYGPGGEFDADWAPPSAAPPPPPPPPEPMPPPEVPPARPGWRTVNVRPSKKKKRDSGPPPAAPPPGPDPRAQVRSWAQWQPEPHLVPTPPSIEPQLLVPDQGSPGLFGPRSPRGSIIR